MTFLFGKLENGIQKFNFREQAVPIFEQLLYRKVHEELASSPAGASLCRKATWDRFPTCEWSNSEIFTSYPLVFRGECCEEGRSPCKKNTRSRQSSIHWDQYLVRISLLFDWMVEFCEYNCSLPILPYHKFAFSPPMINSADWGFLRGDWSTDRPPVTKSNAACLTTHALSYVSNMANPRKFAEKIALHKQKQEEERRAFEQVMKEVSMLEVFFLCFRLENNFVARVLLCGVGMTQLKVILFFSVR